MIRKFISLAIFIILWGCNPPADGRFRMPGLDELVIYQVNPRVFAPEQSFDAIVPQLDRIKDLGCNVLWLMPVYPIGRLKTKNSPYAVKDYYGVNPEFGTMDDFKALIRESHKRGMGVIVDWVPNHTAWDNDWTSNREWYTQDSLGRIIHPRGTGWDDVADLNYDNRQMRLAMIQAMKYWVTEVGVDGFRCDAVDYVPYDFLKQCNDSLRAIPGRQLLLLAEGKRTDHYDAGFDLIYGWDFAAQMRNVYQGKADAASLYGINAQEYSKGRGKQELRFTTNHDEAAKHSPVVEWISERGSMSAFAVILFFPGVPMIYSSQETGYPQAVNFFRYTAVDWTANTALQKEYETLTGIRHRYEALRKGGRNLKPYPDDDILLFERRSGNEIILVAINVRGEAASILLPEHIADRNYINLYTNRNLSLGGILTLQAYEYLILK